MRILKGIGVRGGLIGMAVAVLLLAGCGEKARRGTEARPAQRVICGTPAVAEIVFALGCGDRVVGVSEFTDWPPEAATRFVYRPVSQ
jgi:ABC-type hemin transport system substrate-binding protein